MNIDNISQGQILKNYGTLCAELGIKPKKANSKKAQLKELDRYIKYRREGHSFIIDEIYNNPLPKVDGRGKNKGSRNNNDTLYRDLIQWLLLDLLAQEHNNGHIIVSRSELMRRINMTNMNYSYLMGDVDKLAVHTQMDEDIINDFYKSSNNNFKKRIENALDNLADRKIIIYDKIMKVKEYRSNVHRLAEYNEEEFIRDISKDVLEFFGFDSERDARKSPYWFNYQNELNERLQKQLHIQFYYYAYNISINQKYLDKELKKLIDLVLNDIKRMDCKKNLNELIKDRLSLSAENRHNKEIEKQEWGNGNRPFRADKEYVAKIQELINLLIDNKQPNISEEIKKIKIEDPFHDVDENEVENVFI